MKRRLATIAACVLAALILLSILTSPRKSAEPSGPLLSGAAIDPQVLAIFERACQDCHSDRTEYPWYSYVVPVSLIVKDDVQSGRRHLDLSKWQEYPMVRKQRSLSEIANQVKDRDMPLPQYLWIHKSARLTGDEIEAVFRWTQQERARLIAAGQP